MNKRLTSALLAWLAFSFLFINSVGAQEDQELILRISRDFGYSSGTGRIQGRFSMRVEGPENLERVAFYVDQELIAEDDQPPFQHQFNTGSYAPGVHNLLAIGYTLDGDELRSNQYRREFLTSEQGWQDAFKIVIPILAIVAGVSILGFVGSFLAGKSRKNKVPLGKPRTYGFLGGAICPRCERPFAFHIFGLNLAIRRMDHCSHCGKWGFFRRQNLASLRAAEAAELEGQKEGSTQIIVSEDEKLKRDLDDSRYQDSL